MSISTQARRSTATGTAQAAAQLEALSVVLPTATGDLAALRDVDLTVDPATSVALTGRSGSGKTTLLSVLGLVRRPTAGVVRIDGYRTCGLARTEIASLRSTRVGHVFQSFHLEGSLTAVQNVMLPWYFRHGRTARRAAKERGLAVLEMVDALGLADRRPSDMAEVDRQRVAIARALVLDPALLLADEPTTSLDRDAADVVADLLLSVPRLTGASVVFVTSRDDVAATADTQVRLHAGELAAP